MPIYHCSFRTDEIEFTLEAESREQAITACQALVISGELERTWDIPDDWRFDGAYEVAGMKQPAQHVVYKGKVTTLANIEYDRAVQVPSDIPPERREDFARSVRHYRSLLHDGTAPLAKFLECRAEVAASGDEEAGYKLAIIAEVLNTRGDDGELVPYVQAGAG